MNNCNNCNNELTGKYCSNCGQPVQMKRVDGHYILHEIEHVLHFERGILFTIKELLLRPGKSVKEFIVKDRSKLVKPIIFIIISSLIYTLCIHFFHIENQYINLSGEENTGAGAIFTWSQNHYGYANIIIGLCIAFWLKLFFRKYGYNFFEILILLCFVIGMEMLVLSVFALFEGLTHFDLMKISGMVGTLYCAWATGQFFDKNKLTSYLKALASILLGLILFSILGFVLGLLIDLVIKH